MQVYGVFICICHTYHFLTSWSTILAGNPKQSIMNEILFQSAAHHKIYLTDNSHKKINQVCNDFSSLS